MSGCRICGNDRGNRAHRARESFSGSWTEFDYLECARCGCLQICEIPPDLDRYYADGYYAYEAVKVRSQGALEKALRRWRAASWLSASPGIGRLLFGTALPEHFQWMRTAGMRLDSSILDIGCGSGKLLLRLAREGFSELQGVDPYIGGDIVHDNGVTIRHGSLEQTRGAYDLVMLHHSFEHMPEPLAALARVRERVKPGGVALVRIPVCDSHGWRKYGSCWGALDAPRHLYLHTVRSMHVLAGQSGFEITQVSYDQTAKTLLASEMLLRDRPLCQLDRYRGKDPDALFAPESLRQFDALARTLNQTRDGDTACFYLRRV